MCVCWNFENDLFAPTVLSFQIVGVFENTLMFSILFINSVNSVSVCVEIYVRLVVRLWKYPQQLLDVFLWFFFVISGYPKLCI